MADKIISIKLNVDTSDSSKLATITTEYAKELTKVEQRAKDIALIERARVFEIKRQQEAYAEVAGSVAIANALIKKDSPFAQLGIQLAERQLKEYNIALADTAAKLRNISAIQAETRTYSLNIPKDNPIANTNPNAPDNLRPVEQAGKVGESYGASQQRQEELNKARLTRELIQRQDFNTATEAIEKEAATRRNFIAQSEANSRAIMYAGLFDQLEAKQQAHNARTIMYEELFAQQERDIAARKTAQGGYAAQRQQEETNKAANIRNAELASLRTSIEEQHALRMSSFNSSLREQEAQLRSSIAIRNSEEIHGINSIQAARLRAVEQNRLSEATRQNSISNITSAVNRSALTQVQGVTAATNANAAYAASIHTNNAALQHLETAHQQSLNTQRNLIVRAAEFIGIYQVLNYTLSTVSQSIRAIPKIGIELDSTNASLLATIGSASGAASVLQALNMEAERTGINIGTLRETFRSFQASTSLAGATLESTWHMFTNLNTVITGLHLTADKANGIFLAMAQIFNKGKVQSEELVKQLGNLLPGAFASFAASMDTCNCKRYS
jgi:tape measure domain-containing protein